MLRHIWESLKTAWINFAFCLLSDSEQMKSLERDTEKLMHDPRVPYEIKQVHGEIMRFLREHDRAERENHHE